MKWEEFLNKVGGLPIIETEILLAGVPDQRPFKVQISRWLKAGNLIQIKRGIYMLSESYRKTAVSEFYVASLLKKPSYVSLEKALAYHGLIPEAVPVYTSVTTKMTARFESAVGVFDYRHIKNNLFWGYDPVSVNKQVGFIASPEKALLDLCYFKGRDISLTYMKELRLQNVEKIGMNTLFGYAKRFLKPGIASAAKIIASYVDSYSDEEKEL